MITLEIQKGNAAPTKRAYPDEQITIGRRKENLLVLEDKEVSGRHALIEKTLEGWVVVDRGSTNGTLVNGERIAPEVPFTLRNDTRVTIGPYTITGEFGGSVDIGATMVSSRAAEPPPVDEVANELAALFATHLRSPVQERTKELRAALHARHDQLGDAAMAQVLEELVQRFAPPESAAAADGASVDQEFYPAGFKVLGALSRRILGRPDQFAVVEEVDRFGELLGAFVQATSDWIVRCIQVRNDLKEQFGSDVTRYLNAKRAAVEAAASPADVARTLLDWTDHARQAKATTEQLETLFKVFVAQQGCLLEGAKGVADEVLRHLAPDAIEARAQQTAGLMGSMKMSVAKTSPLWQAYCAAWKALEGGGVQNEVVIPKMREAFARVRARGGDES